MMRTGTMDFRDCGTIKLIDFISVYTYSQTRPQASTKNNSTRANNIHNLQMT